MQDLWADRHLRLEAFPKTSQVWSWSSADRDATGLAVMGDIKDYSPLTTLSNLRHLWVWAANPGQLDILGRLPRLETLAIAWLRSVKDLSPLASLVRLRALWLEGNLKNVSLNPVGRMETLEALSIRALMSTAMNGKAVRFPSFDPLASLVRLEHLELYFVDSEEGRLEPLTRLKSLKTLEISNLFSLEEFARLSAGLPHTKGIFQSPHDTVDVSDSPLGCKKCPTRSLTVLLGKSRRSLLCPTCDAARIEKHAARFEELCRSFRTS